LRWVLFFLTAAQRSSARSTMKSRIALQFRIRRHQFVEMGSAPLIFDQTAQPSTWPAGLLFGPEFRLADEATDQRATAGECRSSGDFLGFAGCSTCRKRVIPFRIAAPENPASLRCDLRGWGPCCK